jgi:hypothetical protein
MSQPPHVQPQQCVVAQLGRGPAVMIRGGHGGCGVALCVGGWVGADEVS